MRIVTASQMAALEQDTYQHAGLPPLLLMENAGRAVAALAWHLVTGTPAGPAGPFPKRLWTPAGRPAFTPPTRRPGVIVVAGKGNNGGDGLCAARHLHNWGCGVKVALWAPGLEHLTADARLNLEACRQAGIPVHEGAQMPIATLAESDLIIDGLLGTGVKGPVRGPLAQAVAAVQAAGRPVLAIDLPSGVDSDTGRIGGEVVSATWTLTLGLPKRGLFLYPGAARAGEIWVADIGIPAGSESRLAGQDRESGVWCALTSAQGATLLPRLPGDVHKGTRGQVLLVGGSRAMPGAIAMAARSSLRSGAGLVYAAVPEPAGDLVAAHLPEVITHRLPAHQGGLAPSALEPLVALTAGVRALAIGPGLGRSAEAAALVRELVPRLPCPAVLDADGLRAFVGCAEALCAAPAPLVLTPHAGEAAALLMTDAHAVQADRAGALQALVERTGQTVILKGPFSLIGGPDGMVWVNLTGSRALATAGSGDILTGIVAAFLARGLPPLQAAGLGALVHGMAGERAGARRGHDGVVAGDLPEEVPLVLRDLSAQEEIVL